MPLRGRNRATEPSVQVPFGGRRSMRLAQRRHAVGNAGDALGRNAAADHVLAQAGRDGDQPVGVAHGRPFHQRVDPVQQPAGRIAAGRAVDVIHERHARAACGQPAHQRGPRRVCVDQLVAVVAHQRGEPLHDAQIEPAAHRHFDQRRVLAFAGRREPPRLDAREADLAAESRQLPGEQVLHALGPE